MHSLLRVAPLLLLLSVPLAICVKAGDLADEQKKS